MITLWKGKERERGERKRGGERERERNIIIIHVLLHNERGVQYKTAEGISVCTVLYTSGLNFTLILIEC